MTYILPSKDLLEKHSNELDDEKKYYSLSKLTYKKNLDYKLLFPVGIDKNNNYFMDLTEVSSILITGETGSGKSVFLNSLIISLLLKNSPEELKFFFVDPRNVELSLYNGIPHLINKVAFSKEDSLNVFRDLNDEIEKRIELFVEKSVKSIKDYNNKFASKLPHILVVIDEAADIISEEDFKNKVSTIVRNGYKYGVHLILASSSYLKNYIPTKILNSFDYLLTFDLASKEGAKYIKMKGSDLLTIYGEALVRCRDDKIINIQTPYVSTKDIDEVVNFIKSHNS